MNFGSDVDGELSVVWNEKGRAGKSSIKMFLVGTSELPFLFLRVKSAACLLLIRAGSSFISMMVDSFEPKIEQLLGKKTGILMYLPSTVTEGLRPRGVGGQVRFVLEVIGFGELNDTSMVAGVIGMSRRDEMASETIAIVVVRRK